MTYADDKTSHMKVEFSFDVLQVARGNYAPQSYHDFIGFEVSKEVLERAFHDTYSLELKDVFGDLDLALGTYRRSVSAVIPELTRVAWNLKKDELSKATPSVTQAEIRLQPFQSELPQGMGRQIQRPGIRRAGARVLHSDSAQNRAAEGPLRLNRRPQPTTSLFEPSFNRALDEYRSLLAEEGEGTLKLDDRDFDTGKPTSPANIALADDAYAKLDGETGRKKIRTTSTRRCSRTFWSFTAIWSLPLPPEKTRGNGRSS